MTTQVVTLEGDDGHTGKVLSKCSNMRLSAISDVTSHLPTDVIVNTRDVRDAVKSAASAATVAAAAADTNGRLYQTRRFLCFQTTVDSGRIFGKPLSSLADRPELGDHVRSLMCKVPFVGNFQIDNKKPVQSGVAGRYKSLWQLLMLVDGDLCADICIGSVSFVSAGRNLFIQVIQGLC
jgi:hypothetical protein